MNSLCETIAPSIRPSEDRRNAEDSPPTFTARCRALLDEARALGLDLDDVIDALRRSSLPIDQSN